MKISIFGLGYVGAVTAGCLTRIGHQVVGVDVSASKAETLNRGESPIVEPGLEELLQQAKQRALLRAVTDAAEAVRATDVSLVCVGTPSAISGAIDLRFVRQVANEIGRLSKQVEVDSTAVLSLLCRDTKLNLSPYYLRPGNPFGGSCLPKDVRALNHFSRQQGVPLPLLENLLPSNEQHLRSLL